MAILAYFEKTAEGPATVSYRWGDSPEELDRELVIDKASSDPLPGALEPTIQYRAVARKVIALRESSGRWPEQGMTFS